MDLPVLTADDPAANRKVWSEWLRRSDWDSIPTEDGDIEVCDAPWDVGLTLATEHWPRSEEIIASDEYEYQEDVEEAVMRGCYGLRADERSFDPAELPDRIRNRMLMAIRAAQSAQQYDDILANIDKNSIAEMMDADEWNLIIIGGCLIGMWEYDPSPMGGAIMSPPDVARLIADILDAAPPSLLAASDA
jgi:hypothetical protein